jgi:hypothetical protein
MSPARPAYWGDSRPKRIFSPLAALLSYLVPGLGQIFQGRLTKGLFFMVSLYAMFFGGMCLGEGKNVYIPDTFKENPLSKNFPPIVSDLYNRPQFLGQFWIGVAAWPAILQYNQVPLPFAQANPFWQRFQQTPPERPEDKPPGYEGKSLKELQTDGDKSWDLGWVYTVIAGVLNVLVMYDAFAGPAFAAATTANARGRSKEMAA